MSLEQNFMTSDHKLGKGFDRYVHLSCVSRSGCLDVREVGAGANGLDAFKRLSQCRINALH